jgi:hypothetical protein
MSFFPQMNTAGTQNKAYQLLVGTHGEVVVYHLGDDGKANGFAVTSTGHELIRFLAAEFVKGKGATEVLFYLDSMWTCNTMLGEIRWARVVEILNGKSSATKARMEGRLRFAPSTRYMAWDDKARKYVVTEIGKKLDAMHDKPKAAPPPAADATGDTGG